MTTLEKLASKLHDIYIVEAKRQGDVRHKDKYEDLSENIKEFDRVLARYILERERELLDECVEMGEKLREFHAVDNDHPSGRRGNQHDQIYNQGITSYQSKLREKIEALNH